MRRKRPWKWKGGLSNSTAFSCSFVLRKVCWLRPIRMINILHAITVFLQEKIRKKLSTKHWIVKIWVPIPIAFYPTSRKYRLLFVSLIMFDFHIWWWLVWYPIKYNIKKWNTFFSFSLKWKILLGFIHISNQNWKIFMINIANKRALERLSLIMTSWWEKIIYGLCKFLSNSFLFFLF